MKPVKKTLPPMKRAEWEALPEAVRYFIPWTRARRKITIKPQPPTKSKKVKP